MQIVDVAIVGAGFAGLCAAIRLKQQGRDDFVLLEAASTLGGTWRDNTYPGAACDVPSFLYSFSFAQWPHWSRFFAPQAEILAYMEHCADRFGIRPHIRFDAPVAGASFDADAGRWRVEIDGGEPVSARALIVGTGALSRPRMPDLPGLDSFAGPVFHSARWRHDVDLTGRRVAVIGTGASAIQVVPAIAPRVAALDLYQRTPPWIVPRPDRRVGPAEQALYRRIPLLQRLHRWGIYWLMELRGMGYVHPSLMAPLRWHALYNLRRGVPDPALRARLTPDYAVGCKRLLVSDDYYPAVCRDNVDLIDGGARAVTAGGVVGADGTERPAEVLVLCTGFQASEAQAPFPVVGLDGADLAEAWRHGGEAYYGTAVAGFPNLFLIVGPNTGLGHSSMIFIIETQVDYVLQCLDVLWSGKARWLVPRRDAQARFNAWVQQRMRDTVWTTGCKSWYLDANGRNTTLWPGLTADFRLKLRRPRLADFELAT